MAIFTKPDCPECGSKDVDYDVIKATHVNKVIDGANLKCRCRNCSNEWETWASVTPGRKII